MFPVPRIIYSMADDGLLFACFSSISARFRTPINAILLSGLIASLMTLIFDLDQLIDMMSIGSLFAYSVVSVCVVILRFRPDSDSYLNMETKSDGLFQQILKPPTQCTHQTASIANCLIGLIVIQIVALLLALFWTNGNYLTAIGLAPLAVCIFLLAKQPENTNITTFKVK
jgi:amino acid transporter